jgi:hypothetical protein
MELPPVSEEQVDDPQEDAATGTRGPGEAEQEHKQALVDDRGIDDAASTETSVTLGGEPAGHVGWEAMHDTTLGQLATLGAGQGESIAVEAAGDASDMLPA